MPPGSSHGSAPGPTGLQPPDQEPDGCTGACRYLNALQTQAQHLLRYLAAAVVINKRRRGAMKDLMRCIEQESYEYSDPITRFLDCLFLQYDFEGAQQQLALCEQVLHDDYFLTAIKEVSLPCCKIGAPRHGAWWSVIACWPACLATQMLLPGKVSEHGNWCLALRHVGSAKACCVCPDALCAPDCVAVHLWLLGIGEDLLLALPVKVQIFTSASWGCRSSWRVRACSSLSPTARSTSAST